ncbi:DUF4381 domain-containing protein [Echinicola sp. CAU 1574]|uniref:DUF4381 domain-containing protein n=1 Tax=Echinicola arenosa TaxID=2774144 RepID=A0ABR9AF72_9BACT|nr:DUF4381 domain-containing protein [Echinicola arenosa]MBD8487321.1 DUF4381 domain-containing protein [Echinicola arenosa]
MKYFFQSDSLVAKDSTAVAQLLQGAKLYEPEAVKFSFETIGWTVVGVVLLLGILVLIFFGVRSHIKNKYRREALEYIKMLSGEDQRLMEVFVVLKNTAMKAFGRNKVGGLYGHDWLAFLEKTGKQVEFLDRENEFMAALYKNDMLSNEGKNRLLVNAEKWIRTHAREL